MRILDVLQFHYLNIDNIPSNFFFLAIFFSFGSNDSLLFFYTSWAIFTLENSFGILFFSCTHLLYCTYNVWVSYRSEYPFQVLLKICPWLSRFLKCKSTMIEYYTNIYREKDSHRISCNWSL